MQQQQSDAQLNAIITYLNVLAQKIEGKEKVTKSDIRNLGTLLEKKELFSAQQLKAILEPFIIRVGLVLCAKDDSTFADPSPEIEKTRTYKLWKCIDEIVKHLSQIQGMVVVQPDDTDAIKDLNILGKKKHCKRCCMRLKKTWWWGKVVAVSAGISAIIVWLLEPMTEI